MTQLDAAALEALCDETPEERRVRGGYGPPIYGDVHDDAPGPCPECPLAARCSSLKQACEQFAIFVRVGGTERWRGAARQPSWAIFRQLFATVS